MSNRITQTGVDVWVSQPAAVTPTQVGLEAWYAYRADLHATQVGIEIWRSVNDAPSGSGNRGAALLVGL